MDTNTQRLYLFGDQTFDVQPHLVQLLQNRHNPVLADFLHKAYNVIRAEVFRLPGEIRSSLPRFTSVEDLSLWKVDGKSCVALDMAITCMHQLGVFIVSQAHQYPNKSNARVLGSCTGALASAAVSCSDSLVELVPMAVHSVAVAFRIGVQVTNVAKRIDISTDANSSWSMVVVGSKASEAVQLYCKETAMPSTMRPYVSVYGPRVCTVSGPPSSLVQLQSCSQMRGLNMKRIAVHGPFHAPHLFSSHDIEDILGPQTSEHRDHSVKVPSLPNIAGGPEPSNFADALKAAAEQILLFPIRWEDIIEEVNTWLANSLSPSCKKELHIIPIGSTADQMLYSSIKDTESNAWSQPTHTPRTVPETTPSPENLNPDKPRLAIIGMSGRFPGANSNEAFWDILCRGLDVHKPVPPSRWSAKTHVDLTETQKNTSATPYGCWLENPDLFDARFFSVSPREAPQMDPAQRLALMTAYEAIEMAGIVADSTPSTRRDRVGVIYGVTSNDWMETNSAQNIDAYFIPGGNRAFIPGRINYCFKFSGPSYAIDTACSSSMAAIHLACNALWQRDIDTAIAGGTNILTNPDFTAGLDRGHFLSRTGNCKTFDDSADGYCRGEGVGTVILKRLDDAMADNDPILAVVLGASTNHSAESESITRPHVDAQRAIFHKVLNQAAVKPNSVDYIEMHGTGTQVGDASEITSVLDVFAPSLATKSARASRDPLYIGSAKANIGHGEAASGVSSLIKVIMMMQKQTIVPHCGIKTKINRRFPLDMDERNVRIALDTAPWRLQPDAPKPRRAVINNFSAAGGNSVLLIEDAPPQSQMGDMQDERTMHLVAVSAKTKASLQGNLRSMLDFMTTNPDVSLGQLSYTTTARRIHHPFRVMLRASNIYDLCAQGEQALRDNVGTTRPKSVGKVVFAFTGQGAQYPGMGKQLFDSFHVFRREILQLDHLAMNLGFPSIVPVIESQERDMNVFPPVIAQLATTCLQIALTRLWASWNITPTSVVGHSLGEYAALNAAGVLSDADTIYLVGNRAHLLDKFCTRGSHAMLVVKQSLDKFEGILKGKPFEVACLNSPAETVLAGAKPDMLMIQGLLGEAGVVSKLLDTAFAFHSSQMDPILPAIAALGRNVTFGTPRVAILSPLYGSIVEDATVFDAEYLARQCRMPVDMRGILEMTQFRVFTKDAMTVEIGPHSAVSAMIQHTLGSSAASCFPSLLRNVSVWLTLSAALKSLYMAGSTICWSGFHADFKASHRVVALPAYNWDLQSYWIQYVNDWSLRKGDAPQPHSLQPNELQSSTIHRVVEESSNDQVVNVILESNIAREDLSPLVQGHEVDGIPLCTPSVYADIALSLGKHFLERYLPDQKDRQVDVSSMEISKALILQSDCKEQLVQVHAELVKSTMAAKVGFKSFYARNKLQQHAHCIIHFRDHAIKQELARNAQEVRRKVKLLYGKVATATAARFNRSMVYRMIRPLARFHEDYRAIDEVVLDSATLEATSRLSFDKVNLAGSYHTHPAIIDALTQSCGFTMNCNDNSDLDVEVFMNHGWGSLQIFEPIDPTKTYTTYTQMTNGLDNLWTGDVVVFDGDRVVAGLQRIALQGVPRRVLKVILSIETRKEATPKPRGLAEESRKSTTIAACPKASTKDIAERNSRTIAIIAEASGIDAAELSDDTVLADAGVDSLMALSIASPFEQDLGLELDFMSMLADYPTVGQLKRLVQGHQEASIEAPLVADTTHTVAGTSHNGHSPVQNQVQSAHDRKFERALAIIADEAGIAAQDLTDGTNLSDSGLDSLLSLVIVGRLNAELDLQFESTSFFIDIPTIGSLRRALGEDSMVIDNTTAPTSLLPPTISHAQRNGDHHFLNGNANEVNGHCLQLREFKAEGVTSVHRKRMVDYYIQKFVAGFSGPATPTTISSVNEKRVILLTGGTGSLGSHLVCHLAQLDDVSLIICINRNSNSDPLSRQLAAMKSKGAKFMPHLQHKLKVFQTDTSKSGLGLSPGDYDDIVGSVTHVIHNAWPMSAKRQLEGFESQFQIMCNLIDFGCDVIGRRCQSFRLSFQMVSSIGVVGHHKLESGSPVYVPEERVHIDSVLTNGYSEAKWGCERMLDETLHKYPQHFRPMVVRLGQIAGCSTSGYWNPMEHFGFLVKSSQTIGVLPDLQGDLRWTPVNDVAATLSDLALSNNRNCLPVYHIDNPKGQPWACAIRIIAKSLHISTDNLIPFEHWIERVRAAPLKNNPASTLLEFLDHTFLRMSCGELVLDTTNTVQSSRSLAAVGPISDWTLRKYIHIWKEIGFLEFVDADREEGKTLLEDWNRL